jgi:hypothetical protein
MLSTALKDIANDLGVFVMSATQLNGNWQEFKGIRNQNLLRGSKRHCRQNRPRWS